MYCTTISTAGYINIIAIHITYNATNITYDECFITSITASHMLSHKIISKTSTGSHNIAAVINTAINSTFSAKVTSYTANIMCSAHLVFAVSCISNVGIFCTPHNTAYITGCIIDMISSILLICVSSAIDIASISYIFYCAAIT